MLAFNLSLLGLWVGVRLLQTGHEREIQGMRLDLPPPDEGDEELTELHQLLDRCRDTPVLSARGLRAEARVRVSKYLAEHDPE